MDVSSRITAAVSHLAAAGSAATTAPLERVESPPPPPAPEGASSTELSRPGRLISKLSQLRDAAPQQFKQAVSDIASELLRVSEQDSGMGAHLLVDLANKLDEAASAAERSADGAVDGSARPPTSVGGPVEGPGAPPADATPHAANRAAVGAYRATAEAHATAAAAPGLSRALDSLGAAGAAPTRR